MKPVHRLPNSVQLERTLYSPDYIRVRAVVWECGNGQTERQIHRQPWPLYISPRLRLARNITKHLPYNIEIVMWPQITVTSLHLIYVNVLFTLVSSFQWFH